MTIALILIIIVLVLKILYYSCIVKGLLLYIAEKFGAEELPEAKTVVDYANLAVLKTLKLK